METAEQGPAYPHQPRHIPSCLSTSGREVWGSAGEPPPHLSRQEQDSLVGCTDWVGKSDLGALCCEGRGLRVPSSMAHIP